MTLTVSDNFTLQITMNSDWHVGSGSGRGEIDSEVQRDVDSLPYIPAKTLTGILRDGCEQVALALDEGNLRGQWYNWVNFLFGDQPNTLNPKKYPEDQKKSEIKPRSSVVSIQSARLNETLRKALIAKPQLKQAIAFIKPSVAIDSETGSAKPNFLRFEEVVRMDAVLTAENCALNFEGYPNIEEDQKKIAFALLIAGTKMVERLGGKRRRGNGKCEITISSEKGDDWLKWLRDNYQNKGNLPAWERSELGKTEKFSKTEVTSTWFRVPLTIETLSPIVLPKRTVGNVVECLDYIPGRYFLGHLHKVLGSFMDVSGAISRGELVITNATIEIDGVAGRPTPFCIFSKKLEGGLSKTKVVKLGEVYNRFQEAEPKDEQGKDIQIKGERSGYVGQFDGSYLPSYKPVKLEVNTHNTIDDDKQRPTGGAVYSYQAIPANTTFKAELRLPKSIKEHLDSSSKKGKDWWKDLHAQIRIGQSKKDQYGSVKISAKKVKQYNCSKDVKKNDPLFVWFLSDILMRDERLNPTTNPKIFREVLQKELGVTLEERPNSDLLSLMMKSRRTESWQVRWGLPRPTLLGWQAGSCVVYEVNGEIKPGKLAELEARGIGDRRAEGYGQICFNDPLLMATLQGKIRQDSTPSQPDTTFTPISQSDLSFAYARMIEKAAWREAIENKALALAANASDRERILGIKIDGKDSQPPMSQLGGLRSPLRRLQSLADQNYVTNWITALESVPNRKEKWNKTDNGLGKIRELVSNSQKVWQMLDVSCSDLTITTGGRNELQENLWAEAVRTLVDAIIRAYKRDLEKAQKDSNNGEAA